MCSRGTFVTVYDRLWPSHHCALCRWGHGAIWPRRCSRAPSTSSATPSCALTCTPSAWCCGSWQPGARRPTVSEGKRRWEWAAIGHCVLTNPPPPHAQARWTNTCCHLRRRWGSTHPWRTCRRWWCTRSCGPVCETAGRNTR